MTRALEVVLATGRSLSDDDANVRVAAAEALGNAALAGDEAREQATQALVASLTAIRDLTEAEFRRRILKIADGTYKSTSWTEYHTEFYKIPCTLTVAGAQIATESGRGLTMCRGSS